MTDEQRAAIARLRSFKKSIADGTPDARGGEQIIGDLWTVADLYLADHPADDAEPRA